MSVSVEIINGPITHAGAPPAAGSGACATFLGVVRPLEGESRILGLKYEAYEPMAENVLRQLCEAACQHFGLLSTELVHSRGFVPVGGVSLRITVSSQHRGAALNALAWLLDGLKRDVPIWKSPDFGKERAKMTESVVTEADSSAIASQQAIVVAVNTSCGGIPKQPVPVACLTVDGLEGDFHEHEKHRRPDRAISIQDLELLDDLRAEGYAVGPGLMGENLTVRNLQVQSLQAGDRLEFDSGAVLELTSIRKPCLVLDQIDSKLKEAVIGRCGYMARVITTGVLRPGQAITVRRSSRAFGIDRTVAAE